MNGSHEHNHQHLIRRSRRVTARRQQHLTRRSRRVTARRQQHIAPRVDRPTRAVGIAASALAVVLSAPIVLTLAPVFVITGGAAVAFIGLALRGNHALMVGSRPTSARSKARPATAAYRRSTTEEGPRSAPPLMIEAAASVRPVVVELDGSIADGPDADVIDLSKMFVDRGKPEEAVAA